VSKGRAIRFFDYVNRPYAQVKDLLEVDASEVFRAATHAAESRAGAVAAALRVKVAGLEVAKDVAVRIHEIEEIEGDAGAPPVTRIRLEWEAVTAPRLFPFMRADLSIYPLTPTETQLDLEGTYEPPLLAIGQAMNAAIGHRIAEASVHQFVRDIGRHLRSALAE